MCQNARSNNAKMHVPILVGMLSLKLETRMCQNDRPNINDQIVGKININGLCDICLHLLVSVMFEYYLCIFLL